MSDRKPRLTAKVLDGLDSVRAAVEASDMLAGDLAHNADAVNAAFEWVVQMREYRAARSRE